MAGSNIAGNIIADSAAEGIAVKGGVGGLQVHDNLRHCQRGDRHCGGGDRLRDGLAGQLAREQPPARG